MPMSGGRWVRLGAAAIFLAGAAVAIVSTAARSLDVQGNDQLARAVSGPDTDQKWRGLAKQLTYGQKPLDDATLAALRAEAVRNPLSASPYFLTGATAKLRGDGARGTALVAFAVRSDPVFMPARYWQIRDAVDREHVADATHAALRAIVIDPSALMNTVPVLVELTRYRDSWPVIRAALPGAANWREVYYNKLTEAKFDPSIVFSAIDVVRASSGKPPGEREQNALLASMTQKADFDRAYTAWLGWLPPEALGKVAYLYDGGFTGAPGAAPFNWTMSAGGDGAAVLDKERGLRFDYSPNGSMTLAKQTVLVPPGRYKLTSHSTLDQTIGQDIPMPVVWRVTCLPKNNVIAERRLPNVAASQGVAAIFDVPADCVAQNVSLEGTVLEFPTRAGGYVRSLTIEKAN
jgi:hypothetical protein